MIKNLLRKLKPKNDTSEIMFDEEILKNYK